MGKPTAGSADIATRFLTGTLTSATTGGWMEVRGGFYLNVALFGTWVGTVTLEKSYDGTTTAVPVSRDTSGTASSWTAPMSQVLHEPEAGVSYRFNCTAYTSGTISWRISQ